MGSVSRTTISLQKETRIRLKALGRKGETYDDLVNRLIDRYLGIEARSGRGPRAEAEGARPEVDFEQVS